MGLALVVQVEFGLRDFILLSIVLMTNYSYERFIYGMAWLA
jgi:hypothetical protein